MAKKSVKTEITENRKYGTLDARGREIVDPEPLAMAPAMEMSLRDRVRSYVRNELSLQAYELGVETFEEANDFDIEDPYDMDNQLSKYEFNEEFEENPILKEDFQPEGEDSASDPDAVTGSEPIEPEKKE